MLLTAFLLLVSGCGAVAGRPALPAGTIEMPNYVGANAQQSSNDLRRALGQALAVSATGGAASSGYPVLSQSPAAGTPINLSSQIIFYTAAPIGGAATGSTTTAAQRSFTLKVEGTASRATVYYGVSGSTGGGETVRLPWTRTMTDTSPSYGYATLSANTASGEDGDLTCSIVDESGAVLAERSAASQGGSFGSASVICGANRSN